MSFTFIRDKPHIIININTTRQSSNVRDLFLLPTQRHHPPPLAKHNPHEPDVKLASQTSMSRQAPNPAVWFLEPRG